MPSVIPGIKFTKPMDLFRTTLVLFIVMLKAMQIIKINISFYFYNKK